MPEGLSPRGRDRAENVRRFCNWLQSMGGACSGLHGRQLLNIAELRFHLCPPAQHLGGNGGIVEVAKARAAVGIGEVAGRAAQGEGRGRTREDFLCAGNGRLRRGHRRRGRCPPWRAARVERRFLAHELHLLPVRSAGFKVVLLGERSLRQALSEYVEIFTLSACRLDLLH